MRLGLGLGFSGRNSGGGDPPDYLLDVEAMGIATTFNDVDFSIQTADYTLIISQMAVPPTFNTVGLYKNYHIDVVALNTPPTFNAISFSRNYNLNVGILNTPPTFNDITLSVDTGGIALKTVSSSADNLIAQWDAGFSESYDNSTPGDLLNMQSPANGDTASDYDFDNTMAFTGTTGVGGSYLTTNGSSTSAVMKLTNANIPDFLKDMAKTISTNKWTFVAVLGINTNLNGKAYINNVHNPGSNCGIYNNTVSSGNNLRINVYDGAGGVQSDTIYTTALSASSPIIMCWSYNGDTNTFKYAVSATSWTAGGTFNTNTTVDCARLAFMESEAFSVYGNATSRFYGAAIWNTDFSDAQLLDVVDWYEAHTGADLGGSGGGPEEP